MRRSLFILIPALALAGCATMINKTFQEVTISTPGVVGAECIIDTAYNKYKAITPQIVQIERGADTLIINCHKATYYDAQVRVKPHMRGLVILNTLNGFVPGTAYDVAANADMVYPRNIDIPMQIDPQAFANSRIPDEPVATPPDLKPQPGPEVDEAEPDLKPAEKSVSHAMKK